jgi:hypothetical protein
MNHNQFAITRDCIEPTGHAILTFRTTVHHPEQLTTRIGTENAFLQGLALLRGHHQHHVVNLRTLIKHS